MQQRSPNFVSSIFAPDVQALSLFRILFGLVLLADFIIGFLPTRLDFYADSGLLPRALVQTYTQATQDSIGQFSLLNITDAPWFLDLFTWMYGAVIIAFIIGYRTRITKVVLFVLFQSMYYRAYPVIMGADILMGLLLLWCVFVPLDRYWSVDSALRRTPRDMDVPPVCMAGIKIQVMTLYVFSGLFKTFGAEWWNGTAIGYAMRDTAYGNPWGEWVATQLPWLSGWMCIPVMLFQLLFSVLVYFPFANRITRSVALIGAVIMHVAFILFLSVGLFPLVCLSYLVLLVPDAWWNVWLAPRRKRLEQITLYFDPDCGFCEKTALLLRECCLSPFTQVLPANVDRGIHETLQQHQSWVVVDAKTGVTYLKWGAVAFVLRQNPITYLLGVLSDVPFLRRMWAGLYDAVGRQRKALGVITSALLPFDAVPAKPAHIMMQICCGVLIVVSIAGNIVVLPPFMGNEQLSPIRQTAKALQVYQRWNLFAPSVVRWKYEFEFEGLTAGHQKVDLMPLVSGKYLTQMPDGRLKFDNTRMHKYMLHLRDKNKAELAEYFLQHLCRTYNANYPLESGDRILIATARLMQLSLSTEPGMQDDKIRVRSVVCK